MKKINKYFNIGFIISLVCIFLSFIFIITYSFLYGKTYVTVNDKNRDIIIEMLSDKIDYNGKEIVRIARKTLWYEPKRWNLYIEFDNGEEKSISIETEELTDLHEYINSNGRYENLLGILAEIFTRMAIISVIFIPIYIIFKISYITFKICYFINKITDKIIEKDK